MKKSLFIISNLLLFALAGAACAPLTSEAQTTPLAASPEPATTTPEIYISLTQALPGNFQPTSAPEQAALTPPAITGTLVELKQLSLVLPPGMSMSASAREYPPVTASDAAWWQKTPGHIQIALDNGYGLQDISQLARIAIYPAQTYAELLPAAFESIRLVDNIIHDPDKGFSPEKGNNPNKNLTPDQLPGVPFLNAKQVFAANIQLVSFKNGSGVRFLTEYAQYPAPVNNQDLFYTFHGLTRDGAYYIVAIFPVSAPGLADTSDVEAALPAGGIAYPGMAETNQDLAGYYQAAGALLNDTQASAFTPDLNQLDALIQSIQIHP